MRVLLVDHDSEGLETIARAIRGVLELDCVTSKGDALLLLRQNTYDVLIACERAVDGSGLDLLGRTTRTAVPLKRIFAAAPERLQLLGPRLAPFKVQRTINYPIDLEELWLAIAQVTGGPNDETDGTIERVVLDERGIPQSGTTPRATIPPRPPAPLGGMRAASTPSMTASSGGARTAAARIAQPVPEPPLRAPAPPRAATRAVRQPTATAQMRASAPPMRPIPPMPMPQQSSSAPHDLLQDWSPESTSTDDDFAQVAEQARLGVHRRVDDETSRHEKLRLLKIGGIAVGVAAVLVFLFQKFYDPEARAREKAIAVEVSRMAEQQKVTDSLTLIEVDIEEAIMNNDLERARADFARLVAQSPQHPRLDFLKNSIDRAEELQKLGGQNPSQSASAAPPPASRTAQPKPQATKKTQAAARPPARSKPERVASRPPDRKVAQRTSAPPSKSRSYGTPIGEPLEPKAKAADAPINPPPPTSTGTPPNGRTETFSGRTLEASDSAASHTPGVLASGSSAASGSAAVMPPAAPAPVPPAPVDVVPAKILKRVSPVATSDVPRNTKGFVLVKFEIGENGRVSNVTVLESTPPGVFDDAATTAVRKWIYEPRKENGVAVPSQAKARLVFDEG